MENTKKTAAERLAEVEARATARADAAQEAWAEQRILDLEACEQIEAQLGAEVRTKKIDVVHGPGLPTLVMVRCPTKPELARYRQGIKVRDGAADAKAATESAELLAAVTVVYPDRKGEVWTALCEARPGVAAGAGSAAISLAVASAQAEGNG